MINPPTTLGNAPSMPATTITAGAALSASKCPIKRWIPATPTSKTSRVSTPAAARTILASSATGRSEVPAVMIAALPPDGSGAKPGLRTAAELGP